MYTFGRHLLLSLLFAVSLISCNERETLYDLSNEKHLLLNTDSTTIEFPGHYQNQYTLVSFIYTHCEGVCPVITANMKNIQQALSDTTQVQFVAISFDPERDTPAVLKNYKKQYRLNNQFSLLTGDTAAVQTLLGRLNIRAEKKPMLNKGNISSSQYMMNHSNILYLMDPEGRIIYEYPASAVRPDFVAEDLNKLR